jgi:hypothetical protein
MHTDAVSRRFMVSGVYHDLLYAAIQLIAEIF